MRKLYRGTNKFGEDSMFFAKDGMVAFMFWPDGMLLEEIKEKLEQAEDKFIYVKMDYLDTISDLTLITEW